jgi:hypothetical protein
LVEERSYEIGSDDDDFASYGAVLRYTAHSCIGSGQHSRRSAAIL